ncbi:MAG: phosphoheptose isomerase [Candidatus Omnitrophota bacterium]|nr:MAG: phosphoheptose isomerase [Candidatus Omnitrophota bacterium]
MKQKINHFLEECLCSYKALKDECVCEIELIVKEVINVYTKRGKLLIFGNGGSAADSQHIAAEFMSRFKRERRALPAIALTTDTSIITAVSNDYSFTRIFSRQIEALAVKGDIAIGISTSGKAENVIAGLKQARALGLTCITLTGEKGVNLKQLSDICLIVPSANTPRIQEMHITVAHIICELVEQALTDD